LKTFLRQFLAALAALTLAWAAAARAQLAPAAGPDAQPTQFSFRAENVPIKQALALFARANHLTIVPDLDVEGAVTVEFENLPLDLAMSALLDANGYYCVPEGRLLRVRNRESRMFQIDYIRSTRTGQGSNDVQISSSGGGGSGGSGGSTAGGATPSGSGTGSGNEGSTSTVANSTTINFWADLAEQLKSLVSSSGSFTINSLAGTVLVRDSHRNIETIAQFIQMVSANIVRQVDLEVDIYEVDLNKSNQLGINWQAVSNQLSAGSIPSQLGLGSGGGLIVQTPVYGAAPGPAAVAIQYAGNNVQAVLNALEQQGDLKVVSRPRLRTLNNQPAVVRVGQDLPVFTDQVTQSPGTPPVITTTETIQTVTVGTVLSITPQISGDGLITLDVTPAVSRLVSIQSSASGQTSAPVIDIRQASSLIRLRDGATVIMGGLVQDTVSNTKRKVPVLGDLPLIGKAFTGSYDNSERTELVFFLTPHIVPDLTGEKSVARPGKVTD
jgi:MSHA type pilus biogenesis protein MshL